MKENSAHSGTNSQSNIDKEKPANPVRSWKEIYDSMEFLTYQEGVNTVRENIALEFLEHITQQLEDPRKDPIKNMDIFDEVSWFHKKGITMDLVYVWTHRDPNFKKLYKQGKKLLSSRKLMASAVGAFKESIALYTLPSDSIEWGDKDFSDLPAHHANLKKDDTDKNKKYVFRVEEVPAQ